MFDKAEEMAARYKQMLLERAEERIPGRDDDLKPETMPRLLLRDSCIGTIDAVLFDKDGTLSHSEPRLVSLAQRRIDTAARLWCELGSDQSLETRLRESLRHAFGIIPGGLRPDGTIAVAAREDNWSPQPRFCRGRSWTP